MRGEERTAEETRGEQRGNKKREEEKIEEKKGEESMEEGSGMRREQLRIVEEREMRRRIRRENKFDVLVVTAEYYNST